MFNYFKFKSLTGHHRLVFKGNGDSKICNLMADVVQESLCLIRFICSVSNLFLIMNQQMLHEKNILRSPTSFFLDHSQLIWEGNLSK